MSSIWEGLVRRIRAALLFVCPFCANDYQYARPAQQAPSEEEQAPKKDVYTPRRDKKHFRREESKSDDFVVVHVNEEAGFSKSDESNSQCADLEVENSEEINRILIRKSQFLPPEPYQPPDPYKTRPQDLAVAHSHVAREDTFGKTLQHVTLDKGLSPTYTWDRPVSPVQYPASLPRSPARSPISPDDFADSASQISKRSRRSIFGIGKKKKPKKDADSQSVFSFASFKSGKSASEISEKLDKKERKRRKKEEKRDVKEVEKQQLNLSHGLGDQKFENIYPWMKDIEPFDDELEVPNVIEEIRIKEALKKKQGLYFRRCIRRQVIRRRRLPRPWFPDDAYFTDRRTGRTPAFKPIWHPRGNTEKTVHLSKESPGKGSRSSSPAVIFRPRNRGGRSESSQITGCHGVKHLNRGSI